MPADHSCVSSSAKITPVNGERITPPTTEASPISAQKPGATAGNAIASSAPSAPLIMNTGANTPPEVPEPSDKDQIRVLTTRMPMNSCIVACPCSRSRITSQPDRKSGVKGTSGAIRVKIGGGGEH